MLKSELEEFLRSQGHKFDDKSDSEKIKNFVRWCNTNDCEELILRLSAQGDKILNDENFLDFTIKRIIIRRKSPIRKLVDAGYIAGMAPLPYSLISNKIDPADISKKYLTKQENQADTNISDSIVYTDIESFELRRGKKTITNMFGSSVKENYLSIKALKEYHYKLPTTKNGSFEKIEYWLGIILPLKIIIK